MNDVRCVDIDDVMRGIEGETAPIRSAAREGIDERTLQAGRGVETIVTCGRDGVAALAAIPECQTHRVFGPDAAGRERRWRYRNRLRRREFFSRRATLRRFSL